MPQNLQQIAAASPEHIKIACMRVALQRLLHLECQAVHAATHVRVAVGQPHPDVGRWHDHRRTAAMIRRRLARPTSALTRTQVPSGSVISTLVSST